MDKENEKNEFEENDSKNLSSNQNLNYESLEKEDTDKSDFLKSEKIVNKQESFGEKEVLDSKKNSNEKESSSDEESFGNEKSSKDGEQKKNVTLLAVKDIFEWIYCIVIAVIIAVLIKYYLGTPTVVKQSSMYPTLEQNDRLILSRINKNKCPERGDIVTFEAPSTMGKEERLDPENPVAKYYYEPEGWWNRFVYYVLEFGKTSYIKRVIGLPGEHVQIKDGKVYIDDKELEEKYLDPELQTTVINGYDDIIVPDNCIFVMGDNRPDSTDSRVFGCIPIDKIEGRVVLRFFPFNKFGNVEKINSIQKEKWDALDNE